VGGGKYSIIKKDDHNFSLVRRTKIAASRIGVFLEKLVDHLVKFHHSAILAQIIFGLAKKQIISTIASNERYLFRSLQRIHDLHLILRAIIIVAGKRGGIKKKIVPFHVAGAS